VARMVGTGMILSSGVLNLANWGSEGRRSHNDQADFRAASDCSASSG